MNLRTLSLATSLLVTGLVACSGNDTSSSSSGGGSSSGTSGTSSTSSSSGSTSTTCKKASLCLNGSCKCTDGPNKDQSCTDSGSGAGSCEQVCKVCETSSTSSSSGGTSGDTSSSSSSGMPPGDGDGF